MANLILNNVRTFKKYLVNKKFQKILVISGKNSFKKSGASSFFLGVLNELNSHYYFKNKKLPEFYELKKIINIIDKIKPDVVIAIGGGSVLDYSKMSSSLSKIEFKKNALKYKFRKKKIHLISVPTTAGSGAEVTEGCVLYYRNIKYSLEDKKFIPLNFFLVPQIIVKCSFKLKATCGLDTLCQSMESMVSLRSTNDSRKFARKSIELFEKYFIEYLNKPNINNSEKMSLSSNYSGKAINLTKTTIPHALSYPLTTLYGLDHGHAVATTLIQIFKISHLKSQKYSSIKKKYIGLFKALKVKNFISFEKKIQFYKKKTKLKFNLLEKITKKEQEKIISQINIKRLKNNPVPLTIEEIKNYVFR